MCFDCKLRAAADRAARPLYWLLLAASVLLLGFVLALMLCGIAAAAPAPLPRRGPAAPQPHPAAMTGDWTFWWYNYPYRYRFRPDGTFEHHPLPDYVKYTGTWRVLAHDTIELTEWVYGRPAASRATYVMRTADGWRWRHGNDFLERGFHFKKDD